MLSTHPQKQIHTKESKEKNKKTAILVQLWNRTKFRRKQRDTQTQQRHTHARQEETFEAQHLSPEKMIPQQGLLMIVRERQCYTEKGGSVRVEREQR